MKSLIVTSARIFRKDDEYYVDSGLKTTIERYREAFGEVFLFGMDGSDKGRIRPGTVLLEGVSITIMGTLRELYKGKANKLLKDAIPQYDLIILRIPSMICNNAARIAEKSGKPYLVEVIGDAFGSLWYHSIRGKLLAIPAMLRTKKTVRRADYATYVSNNYLQTKYPCNNKSVGVSDCMINCSSCDEVSRRMAFLKNRNQSPIRIMNAAAIDVKYKGQQYVIRAISNLKKMGIEAEFYIVGAGNKSYLERCAKECGVERQVVFTGGLPHEKVMELMESVDIYIQPSLTEAIARSVVEALSKGCCCIGTDIGGLKELIPEEYRVKPRKVCQIVERVNKYYSLSDREKEEISKHNIEFAKNYDTVTLNNRRNEYYQYVTADIMENRQV